MTNDADSASTPPRRIPRVSDLLDVSEEMINFADKIVVGLAGPAIMNDPSLKLTPEQFGLLGSSFFFLFAISAVVVGFVSNRVQTKRTLLIMALVWSPRLP